MAASFSTDPAAVGALGLLSFAIPELWRRGKLRAFFNAAQVSIYGSLASAVFIWTRDSLDNRIVSALLGAALAALVAVALNHSLVAGAMSLETGRRIRGVWRELAWPAPHSLAFGLAALLVAVLYWEVGAPAVLFMLAPFFVIRRVRYGKLELEAAHERTLWAFVRAVEVKDEYTSTHSERVAEITVLLHQELGASEETLRERWRAAMLHDIGKVGVSASILQKDGPLSDKEREVVKRHPVSGAWTIGQVDFLRNLAVEVLHHHERIDGQGYPSGLRGESIPFESRVLAVADTFEALTSDRPYRIALAQGEALEEITRSIGTQLDGAVANVLVELVRTGRVPAALPRRQAGVAYRVRSVVAQEA
jgi:hypothetical protein